MNDEYRPRFTVADLIDELTAISPSGTMAVKVSTGILDEHGVEIESLLVQEYDDGEIINELVIIPEFTDD